MVPFPPTILRTGHALADAGLLPRASIAMADAVAARYPVAVPPAFAALIDRADDPIGLQVLPEASELDIAPGESADPIADEALSPVRGVVHRYPDRVLLKPLLVCPVYCRFCFRREQVGPDGGLLSDAELEAAYAYIRSRPELREVILTGGDPLMLSARRLGDILDALEAISHVDILRVHTRVPVAVPDRVTDALCSALDRGTRPLWVAVHANHAREFSPPAEAALARLRRSGAVLLGQSVLLRGVNDNATALEDLFRTMVRLGVKPYYLHALDPAPGTARFRVPVSEGHRLLRALRGRMTGLAWPIYVVDGAEAGKKPVGPVWPVSERPEASCRGRGRVKDMVRSDGGGDAGARAAVAGAGGRG